MKAKSILVIGGAALLMLGVTWFPELMAQPRTEMQLTPDKKVEFPLGRKCVITIDTYLSKPAVVGDANIVTGFAAPDTVTGVVTVWNEKWIGLRDGANENWVRTDKVVMIHIAE